MRSETVNAEETKNLNSSIISTVLEGTLRYSSADLIILKIYFSFIIEFDHCLEANPDDKDLEKTIEEELVIDEDLDKTIEEELVIDDVGAEAIATMMKEASKSSKVPQGMIKKNLMRNISI